MPQWTTLSSKAKLLHVNGITERLR